MPREHPTEDVAELRRFLDDLASIVALPARWTAGAPSEIVDTLLETLLGTMRLGFVAMRLSDPEFARFIEMVRIDESLLGRAGAREINLALDSSLGGAVATWPPRTQIFIRDQCLTISCAPLGVRGELGTVAAGCSRPDFPTHTERLLLSVAAHQAAMGLGRALLQRKTEHDSRLLVDNIPGLVAFLTAEGHVQFVNRQIVEYSGRSLEELRGWATDDTVHPEDLPHVTQTFTQSIASGRPYEIVQRLRRFDGSYRWFQNNGFPLRDAGGQISRWCVLLTDIDERKRAQDALRESEHAARLIVDSIPGFVATFTGSGEVEFINRPMLEYFGKTWEELKRWQLGGMTHPEDLPRAVEDFMRAMASGDPFESEIRARRFDGAYRWFRSRGAPLRDASGQIVRWYNLLTDIDERKHAEQAVEASERNFKLIIDTIPALAWSARTDGSAEFFSQHYLEFVGFSAEQMSGWGWTAAVYPDDLEGLAATWQRIMISEAPGEAEARLRRHDGSYRWFLFRANPLRDESGAVVKWYGVNTDIEDRKRAEQELRRSEALLAQAQRLTLTGSLWWKLATGELTWSDESYRLMAYPRTVKPTIELILNRVHPEDLSLVREMIERSTREGEDMDFELRLLMPDDAVKHVHVVVQNIGRESESPEFMGAVSDITERKRAEAELRRAYDHLAEVQRLSQTGSFTWDLESEENFWSDEFYRISEFEIGTGVTMRRLRDIVHPEDVPLYEGAIERAMAATDLDFHFRIVTSRGVLKHLRVFAHRIADRPVFVGAVQDVTASKIAQQALDKAGAELAHVSRVTSLSALTASIAHEVNQPLSGIITNAGTCLRMLDTTPPNVEGARETARRTMRDGRRAADVIERLRALFSKKEFSLETLDLNEATREVIALSSNDLQRNRISLQFDLAHDLPRVTGDRIQIQQVILNLLRNASDAMVGVDDRPRELLIKTAQENGDRVRLTVRDAGVGLAADGLSSLFDPFYTTKSGGMGIGLYVSRSIIERHQGQLWAEPNQGGPGATFSFCIPRDVGGVMDAAQG